MLAECNTWPKLILESEKSAKKENKSQAAINMDKLVAKWAGWGPFTQYSLFPSVYFLKA